jgi:bifunctional DNA-binding transcriptional regulator/antitoxin component of YhaV-PrlF toxin-antitoxin module
VGQRRQVVIPREIFQALRMRVGGFVAITKQENAVVIKPKRMVDQNDTLSPAEAKQVRLSLKQIKEGRFKLWRDLKHEVGR